MTWKISSLKRLALALVLAFAPLSADAWIEIGSQEETSYYPFPTYQAIARSQYIVPGSLIGGVGAMCSSLL